MFSCDLINEGVGYVKLEELLVEETWSEVLSGELQKPYAKKLCEFVENEICHGSTPIYPPQHLIFNALNTTSFDHVKAVIIGQVKNLVALESESQNSAEKGTKKYEELVYMRDDARCIVFCMLISLCCHEYYFNYSKSLYLGYMLRSNCSKMGKTSLSL